VIDSTHYRPPAQHWVSGNTDTSGKYTVHLNEPIVNAHEVSLLSMSVPNDFFNVREGANTIIFTEIDNRTGNGANFNSIPVVIPVGAYTLNKLVEEINKQIEIGTEHVGSPFSGRIILEMTQIVPADGIVVSGTIVHPRVDTVKMVRMSLLKFSGFAASANRYYYLSHPTDSSGQQNGDYRNSILHRLGFTQAQVPVLEFYYPNIESHTIVNQIVMDRVYEDQFMAFSMNVSGRANNDSPKFANYAGHESYDNLRINCNLVGKGMQTTVRGFNGNAETRRNDILAIVPMIAGPGSLNTYNRPNKGHMIQHMQSRAPITSLTISLTDDNGHLFKPYEHSDFVVVLEFTIVEQVPRIISEVHAKNQHQTFLSRHKPISLDSK
jgi:hypothetical protein